MRVGWFAVVVALTMACGDDGEATSEDGGSTGAEMPADDDGAVLYDVAAGDATSYLVHWYTPLNDLPLQFVADIAVEVNGGFRSLQPLALDLDSATEPRTPVGPSYTPTTSDYNVGFDLTARFDELVVPPEANPWNGDAFELEYLIFVYTPHPGSRCACGLAPGAGVVSNLNVKFEGQALIMGLADPDERPSNAEIEECIDAAENC